MNGVRTTSLAHALLLAVLKRRRPPAPPPAGDAAERRVRYSLAGVPPPHSVLFTTSQGLFLYSAEDREVTRLLDGKYYGVAKLGDRWLLTHSDNRGPKWKRYTDICAVRIEDRRVASFEIAVQALPREIHQIDTIDGRLVMPHTGFNQILWIHGDRIAAGARSRTLLSCASIPLRIARPSHLNSVFRAEPGAPIHLVAHNSTAHTGRWSDILLFREDSGELEVRPTSAHSAHNVYADTDGVLYCDSNHGKLMRDDRVLFASDKLLRGLSVTDAHLLVGGSDIDFEGRSRMTSDATLYLLDRAGRLLGTMVMPGIGVLYEIRQAVVRDYARSS